MKKRYLLLSFLLILGCFTLISRSGGPGTLLQQQATGAPGETTCANCHYGGLGGGNISIQPIGLSGTYLAGQTYQVVVKVTDPDALVGGMQMVALDANQQSVGNFSPPSGLQAVTINGRQYVEHSTPQIFDFSSLPTSATWQIAWTAPLSAQGPITFYAAGVAADWTGGSDNDDVYTTQTSLTSLPVEWRSFSAEALQGGKVRVVWVTEREVNSEFFEVQRSIDGALFEKVGYVAAKGHSEDASTYQFEDKVPALVQEYYYRLRQVDQDGQQQFSEITSVWVPGVHFELAAVYPNPALHQDQVQMELLLPEEGEVEIRLRSIEGKVLLSQHGQWATGRQVISLPVAHLPSGLYFLEVERGEVHLWHRLVVAN